MKVPLYTSTPGLDRYPDRERYGVYCAAHQRLMRESANYRWRWRAYVMKAVTLSVVATMGFGLGGMVDFVVLSLWLGALLILSFKQQDFMNDRIGEFLRQ